MQRTQAPCGAEPVRVCVCWRSHVRACACVRLGVRVLRVLASGMRVPVYTRTRAPKRPRDVRACAFAWFVCMQRWCTELVSVCVRARGKFVCVCVCARCGALSWCVCVCVCCACTARACVCDYSTPRRALYADATLLGRRLEGELALHAAEDRAGDKHPRLGSARAHKCPIRAHTTPLLCQEPGASLRYLFLPTARLACTLMFAAAGGARTHAFRARAPSF